MGFFSNMMANGKLEHYKSVFINDIKPQIQTIYQRKMIPEFEKYLNEFMQDANADAKNLSVKQIHKQATNALVNANHVRDKFLTESTAVMAGSLYIICASKSHESQEMLHLYFQLKEEAGNVLLQYAPSEKLDFDSIIGFPPFFGK